MQERLDLIALFFLSGLVEKKFDSDILPLFMLLAPVIRTPVWMRRGGGGKKWIIVSVGK
jgi:hypothetical protein